MNPAFRAHRPHNATVRASAAEAAADFEPPSAEQVHFRPKAILFRQNEPARVVYHLTRGLVRLSRLWPDGRRLLLRFAVPGDLIGWEDDEAYPTTAEAIVQTEAKRIDRRVFNTQDGLAPELLSRAQAELIAAREHISMLSGANSLAKVSAFLLYFSQAYRTPRMRPDIVILPMPREDIADYLGMATETVCRCLTELTDRNVLHFDTPHIARVISAQGLRAAAIEA